jgi:hypothetical protein
MRTVTILRSSPKITAIISLLQFLQYAIIQKFYNVYLLNTEIVNARKPTHKGNADERESMNNQIFRSHAAKYQNTTACSNVN